MLGSKASYSRTPRKIISSVLLFLISLQSAMAAPKQNLLSNEELAQYIVKDSPSCGEIYLFDENSWPFEEELDSVISPGAISYSHKKKYRNNPKATYKTPFGKVYLRSGEEFDKDPAKMSYRMMDKLLNDHLKNWIQEEFAKEELIFDDLAADGLESAYQWKEAFISIKEFILNPNLKSIKDHNHMLISLFPKYISEVYESDSPVRNLLCRYGKLKAIKDRNKMIAGIMGIVALVAGMTALGMGVTAAAAVPVLLALGITAGVIGLGSGSYDVVMAHKGIKHKEKTAKAAKQMASFKIKMNKQAKKLKKKSKKGNLTKVEQEYLKTLELAKHDTFYQNEMKKLVTLLATKRYLNRMNYAVGIIKILTSPIGGILPVVL